jgi:hypothetical protein
MLTLGLAVFQLEQIGSKTGRTVIGCTSGIYDDDVEVHRLTHGVVMPGATLQ